MRQKITYIHNNPVQRGYVDRPVHWRYYCMYADPKEGRGANPRNNEVVVCHAGHGASSLVHAERGNRLVKPRG